MHHCVGTQGDRVQCGNAYFYSVREEGVRIATLELLNHGGSIVIGDLRGVCNSQVSKTVRRCVEPSPACSPTTVLRSAWTAKGLGGTTCSLSTWESGGANSRAGLVRRQMESRLSLCLRPNLKPTSASRLLTSLQKGGFYCDKTSGGFLNTSFQSQSSRPPLYWGA